MAASIFQVVLLLGSLWFSYWWKRDPRREAWLFMEVGNKGRIFYRFNFHTSR